MWAEIQEPRPQHEDPSKLHLVKAPSSLLPPPPRAEGRPSLGVLVVGEEVVEDPQGGLQVQVHNIWDRKKRVM